MNARRASILLAWSIATAAPDVAADDPAWNVALRAQIDVYSSVTDVWGYTASDGTELAIYGHLNGTSFVDATDPDQPVEVLNLPGPAANARDIKTYLHWAYIVVDFTTGGGLQIVDLSDPHAPVHVTTYTGGNFTTAHNLQIDTGAGYAYACTAGLTSGMHVLSLADPVNPVEVDYFDSFPIHDLWVGNNIAMCAAGALQMMDASDPSNLTPIATEQFIAPHNVWPIGSGAYCATTDEAPPPFGGVGIYRITNPQAIVQSGFYQAEDATDHNVFSKNGFLYISYYTAGVRLVDVVDPWNPVEVGYYDTSPETGFAHEGCWGVWPFRDDEIMYASDRQRGLFILEFTGEHAGWIGGTVRDAVTGDPIAGADVTVTPTVQAVSGPTGFWELWTAGGTYTVETQVFGYEIDATEVVIPPQGFVTHDVDLTLLPTGTVELDVLSAGGAPVAGAHGLILDTPLAEAVADANGRLTFPDVPADLPFTARVGKFGHAITDVAIVATAGQTELSTVTLGPGFHDDFDFDQGWIVGAPDDDATSGIWERAVPVGAYSLGIIAPNADATPTGDGYAYVTDTAAHIVHASWTDVDNGKTTLLTPVFDASGFGALTLEYQRWFSNRAPVQSDDAFRADVSTDGGFSWTNFETTDFGTDSWALVTVDLTALVTPTAEMQLRFSAEDYGEDTFVEAGIDDVRIITAMTSTPEGASGTRTASLASPRPSPFRDRTTIEFTLERADPARLAIYDVRGRLVRTLLAATRPGAGIHRASWDGTDSGGRLVSAGVYFAKLEQAGRSWERKVVFVR